MSSDRQPCLLYACYAALRTPEFSVNHLSHLCHLSRQAPDLYISVFNRRVQEVIQDTQVNIYRSSASHRSYRPANMHWNMWPKTTTIKKTGLTPSLFIFEKIPAFSRIIFANHLIYKTQFQYNLLFTVY